MKSVNLLLRRILTGAAASSILGVCHGLARPDTSDYRSLFLHNNVPLLDVRAPCEYRKGSFPAAQNLPVLTDEERHQVGICYKQQGPTAAVALGRELVSGPTRGERLEQWTNFCREQHPDNGYLYCFRGGMRSQTVQTFLQQETGIRYPLVTGGYKAMRRFLLEELDRSLASTELVLIGGATGSGKTRVIEQLQAEAGTAAIDLEGLAHHRGSSFGRWPEDPLQPAQIDFENTISIELLRIVAADAPPQKPKPTVTVFVEDEGARIGNLLLPVVLKDQMKAAKIAVVQEDIAQRVNVIL